MSSAKDIQKLITIHNRNLGILLQQAVLQGGEAFAPLALKNQIDYTREQIETLEAQLSQLKSDEEGATPPVSLSQSGSSAPAISQPPAQSAVAPVQEDAQKKVYYTYRIRVTNESLVHVEKRDPTGLTLGEPTGKLHYNQTGRAGLDALLQAAHIGALNDASQTRQLGETLFNMMFDPILRQDFVNLYDQVVHKEDKLLRIELDIDEATLPAIAALPWEFMSVPVEANLGTIWLGTAPDLIFSRRRAQWHAAQPIQLGAKEKLRIALAVASPPDLRPVAYEKVYADLQTLARKEVDRIELLPLVENADPEKIDALLAQQPHIFHFIGHGQLDEASSTGQIALVDDLGDLMWIDEYYFGDLFNQHRPGVVMLQACEGGALSASRAFVGVASRVVQQNIPVVVAMQYEVTNSTASRFARRFYQQLAGGDPVDRAAQVGRRSIALGPTQYKSRDFATPVLFMRVPDGHLFQRNDTEV